MTFILSTFASVLVVTSLTAACPNQSPRGSQHLHEVTRLLPISSVSMGTTYWSPRNPNSTPSNMGTTECPLPPSDGVPKDLEAPQRPGQEANASPPNNDYQAATAVLTTNELLHDILLQVPPQQKASLRQVSKVWSEVVSKILAIEPDHMTFWGQKEAEINHFPCYTTQIDFKTNPTIAQLHRPDQRPSGFAVQPANHERHRELQVKRRQFITNPPITVVSLNICHSTQLAMLRVPGGIRIEDLLEMFSKMESCESQRANPYYKLKPGNDRYAYAWFEICNQGSNACKAAIEDGNTGDDSG